MYLEKEPYVALTYECNRKCNYCYALGLEEKFKKEMSPEDFSRLLNWLSVQGVRFVGLVGGEPTIHSKFVELIKIIEKYKLSAIISTNGLFGKEKRPGFESSSMKSVTLHIDEKPNYSKAEYSQLESNADFLSELDSELSLRYVIQSKEFNLHELIGFCNRHSIKEITFSIATPGLLGNNKYVPLKAVKEILPTALRAIEKARASGFRSALATLLPLCFFEERGFPLPLEEGKPWGKCCVNKRGEFDPSILIQPDLSFNVCLKLPINEKNILSFKNLDNAKRALKERFLKLQSKPLMKKCTGCHYFQEGECQGGCLVYKQRSLGQ